MSFLRRFVVLLSAALLGAAPAAAEAKEGPVTKGAVTVELVAHDASIQPGKPFWVALRMQHQPHWHTYWKNAGTGYPTSLEWTLPDGFQAGPIVWPVPHVVKDTNGHITGNGYEDQIFLFTEITPPASLAPGDSVTLRATADWLMCKEVCMPGDAKLALTLPVKSGPPAPNMSVARAFNNAFTALPQASADWTVTAERDGNKATLRLAPAPGRQPAAPTELHYFDENGVNDYAKPQVVRPEGDAILIDVVIASDAPPGVNALRGILAGRNIAGPATGYGGILIDAPFTRPAAASAASGLPAPAPAAGGIFATLFLAFVGGLILNLMPCVFPVLGIKVLGFVNQAGSDKAKVIQHGLVFTAGVLVSFWALAGLLLALRAGGAELGWGFQLQSPAFVFGMAAFLLVFALNLSGLFEVGLSATGAGAALQSKEGLSGSFFTGGLATLVATPCSAPFLAPALGAALTLSAAESLLVFTAIGVGLSFPYLGLSLFPQAVRLLPRPGAWMETFKQLMAFPLYATVGWLLWVLAAQTAGDDYGLLLITFGFVLISMAAWIYGRFGQAHGKTGRQWFGRVAAAALLTGGLWLGWPEQPPAPGENVGYQMVWEKWSPQAVAAAQAAGKFAYVDFTARWCATCQTNKATVFSSRDVLAEFGRRGVVLFRADWTNRDPQITAELEKWQRSAVPFNLIYAPGRPDPVVLPELLTPGIVLDALTQAAQGASPVAAR